MGADQSAFDHAVEAEKQKDFDKAVTLYQNALALNPKMVSAHNNIGIIYKNQGKVRRSNLSHHTHTCLLYTSPSPRDGLLSRMPSSA